MSKTTADRKGPQETELVFRPDLEKERTSLVSCQWSTEAIEGNIFGTLSPRI